MGVPPDADRGDAPVLGGTSPPVIASAELGVDRSAAGTVDGHT